MPECPRIPTLRGLRRLLLAAGSALAGAAPLAAHAQVTVGHYCVTGLGASTGSSADGWLATVSPAGAVTTRIAVASGLLVNPWDCAIDPSTGDVIVVDEGATGSATNGRVLRVAVSGASVTTTTLVDGSPLVNPRGVAVATDGTIYVADVGSTFNTNDNNGRIYAVSFPGGVTTVDALTSAGNALVDSPVDLDIDPRPFGGVVNVVYLERTGQIRRVPATLPGPNTPADVSADPSGSSWEGIEVGPWGSYFLVDDSTPSVQRYDRLTDTLTSLVTLAGTATPRGVTVDYQTGDLVVADSDTAASGGVVNVPPNVDLAGAPARTVVAAPGALPGQNAAGVGFSPPLASASPSANFGVPTRRAPIPGGAFVVIAPSSSTQNGDVERAIDLFIEVTSTASPLLVRIFDPNVRDGYDPPTGGVDTPTTITLFDPAGTTVTSVAIAANGRVDLDQRIATLNSGNTLTVGGGGVTLAPGATGLYRLQIVSPSGDDYNTFGVWVDGFHAYTFSTTTGALVTLGSTPAVAPLDPFRVYPYFDRGCEYAASNFDADLSANPGSTASVTTRLGATTALTLTNNGVHFENTIDPAPAGGVRSSIETDYGLHEAEGVLAPNLAENNIVVLRTPDFQGWVDGGGTGVPVPVPPGNAAANPTASLRTSPGPAFPQTPFGAATNTFLRQYLPRYDATPTAEARPYAPYAMHSLTPLAGNPPSVGSPAFYAVLVTVVNPDPVNAMTNVVLTAPVPAPAEYVTTGTNVSGPASATGGGVVTTCAAPCSGNVGVTWATIPAASAVTLAYAVRVAPTSAGQRLFLTGGPAARGGAATPAANAAPAGGTAATWRPAWHSAAFPRTESLGPLCDLSVVEGTSTPVAVALSRLAAEAGDGEALVVWDTASEFRNLGFHVWRRLAGENEPRRVTPGLILGRGTSDLSAHYAFRDRPLPNDVVAEYWLEDIELDGRSTWHGPVSALPGAGLQAIALDAAELAPSLPAPGPAAPPLLAAGAGTGPAAAGAQAGSSPAPSGDAVRFGAPPGDAGSVRVLSRDAGGVTLEILLPPIEAAVVSAGGVSWTDVSIPGWDATLAPGLPRLPTATFWIEGPERSRYEVRLLERDGTTLALPAAVRPVAEASGLVVADPVAYASATPYPAVAADVVGTLVSGTPASRLLALRVAPARFVAQDGALESDSRLVVRIDALGPAPLGAAAGPSAISANVRALAASPGLWIGARGTGIVRVDGATLLAAGLAPDADPRTLQLYRNGVEQAVRFDGEADGRVDSGDSLLFFAEGRDDRYGDEARYFLLAADTPGRRTAQIAASGAVTPGVLDVPARARDELQGTYLPGILNGDGDNFVGPYVFDRPVVRRVATPGAVAAPATLRIRLRGGTSYADLPEDHHFGVRVGGADVLDVRFDGSSTWEGTAALPAGLVVDGETEVEIVPRFDSGAPFDLIYVDAVDVEHRRAPSLRLADGGRLDLEPDGSGAVVVTGLPGLDVHVWDVTDPSSPIVVEGVPIAADAIAFDAVAGRRYCVSIGSSLLGPSVVEANRPSSWTGSGGADWLAIAPAELHAALAPLVAERERQGLRTALVDVQDVYDEASAGDFTPVAIRDFVRAVAGSWSPAPRHLLLVGDATYDYRGFLGGAARNLVPTMLVDTTFVEAASDAWFGILDDAREAPDLFVGRLPVRDASELAGVVAKLLRYESAGSDADPWRARILTVADDGLGAGDPLEAEAFEDATDGFARWISPDFAWERIALGDLPEPGQGAAANAAIRASLERGAAIALYAGHGGARAWADELVFGAGDVAAIANDASLPVYVVLNCLNAFFSAPNEDSLGEAALRAPDRGAAAFVGSTTVSALAGQDAFARALGERILRANVRSLGEAVTAAKQAIAGDPGAVDVLRTFTLLGDPATSLGAPLVPVADAGADAEAETGAWIQLEGGASRSPAGRALAHAWRILVEPAPGAGALYAPDGPRPGFAGSVPGVYEVALQVDDGRFRSAEDVVRIEVGVAAPVASCTSPGSSPGSRLSGWSALHLVLPLALSRPRRRRRAEGDPRRR